MLSGYPSFVSFLGSRGGARFPGIPASLAVSWKPRAAAVAGAVFLAACGGSSHDDASNAPRLTPLSTQARTASGGDVLLQVSPGADTNASQIAVTLNGQTVTSSFLPDGSGNLVGLVSGLSAGENTIVATTSVPGGVTFQSTLKVTNHASTGPIFSGPRQQPWVCETEASGLGAAPAQGPCVAATKYEWFYRTTAGTFEPLPSLTAPYPANLATTTTIDGTTVNYIVRVESGTINESIYRISILADPAAPIANPWAAGGTKPGPGWNGKLLYHFGGGCGPGFRSGRNTALAALNISDTISVRDEPLSLGFAVALGTRNTLGTGCDDVTSAETVAMIKERFIEQYGKPKFTIGIGSSGGAMQQHLISHNYPGLLDALIPVRLYPDTITVVTDVLDCGLLNNYFNNVVNAPNWPAAKRSTVDGYPVDPQGRTNCNGWNNFARNWPDPTDGFDAVVPVAARYHPVTNRTGARGTFQDGIVNALGIDPLTGFARQPYDNIGVQYGLQALKDGAITPQEFLDLNEAIGGLDIDGNIVATRSTGDTTAIARAYSSGRVNDGEHLTLPTIHYRNYVDFANDIHTYHRTLAMWERLQKKNGTTDNVVRWTMPQTGTVNFMRMALLGHNEWMERLLADSSDVGYAQKVINNKPSTLTNACWDDAAVRHDQPVSFTEPGVCNTRFPVHADPRIVAGGPRSGDILKCQLKPVAAADYPVAFSAAEMTRLIAIFPGGVCDWSKPGVGQQAQQGTWLSFPTPGQAVSLSAGSN